MAAIDGVHKGKTVKSNSTGASFALGSGNVQAQVTDGTNPLQCIVKCDGGDVEIGLQDDGTASGNVRGNGAGGTGNLALVNIYFYRDGVQISSQESFEQNNSTLQNFGVSPCGFSFTDKPTPGTHTYTVYASSNDGGSIQYSVLYAVQR